jgi:hypothetical protein
MTLILGANIMGRKYTCDYAGRWRLTWLVCLLTGRKAHRPGGLGCKEGDKQRCAREHSQRTIILREPLRRPQWRPRR